MDPRIEMRPIDAQPILAIRVAARQDELPAMMGALFEEVYACIERSGQAPAGMPLALYHSMEGGSVDFACGMPVAAPLPGEGRVEAGELAAGTVVTATHMGPYDTLGETWEAVAAWVASHDLQPAGAPWEVYQTDPGAEPDTSKWRTDIFFPVR